MKKPHKACEIDKKIETRLDIGKKCQLSVIFTQIPGLDYSDWGINLYYKSIVLELARKGVLIRIFIWAMIRIDHLFSGLQRVDLIGYLR